MTAVLDNLMAAQGLRCAHDPRPDPYTLTPEREAEQAALLAAEVATAACPYCGDPPEDHRADGDGSTYCPPLPLGDEADVELCTDCACPWWEHPGDVDGPCPDQVPLPRIPAAVVDPESCWPPDTTTGEYP